MVEAVLVVPDRIGTGTIPPNNAPGASASSNEAPSKRAKWHAISKFDVTCVRLMHELAMHAGGPGAKISEDMVSL